MVGQYVIVRSANAGVFAGQLERLEGEMAELTNARRIWYWSGAASLSELATRGTKRPLDCKFPVSVERVIVIGVCEVLSVTPEARKSIEEVIAWEA